MGHNAMQDGVRHPGRRTVLLRALAALVGALAFMATPRTAEQAGADSVVLSPVVVRQAPDPAAAAVMTLPGGAQVGVVFIQRGPGGEWARILTASGIEGFVPSQSVSQSAPNPAWRSIGGAREASISEPRESGIRIKLKRAGEILLVPARFNGQVDTLLVLDTGASHVVISEALATRMGIVRQGPPQPALSANGVHYVRRALLDSVHLPDESGAAALKVEAKVGDLPGFPPGVGGLLGQTFLRRFRVSIDAERLVLELTGLSVNGAKP
jgi:predicted aspartyl protease